jgi:hypothetical protein
MIGCKLLLATTLLQERTTDRRKVKTALDGEVCELLELGRWPLVR